MLVNYFGPRPMAAPTETLHNGLKGIQAGQAQVDQASSNIARRTVPEHHPLNTADSLQQTTPPAKATDATGVSMTAMTRELINLHQGELIFKANARSIEAAQHTFDSLLGVTQEHPQSSSSSDAIAMQGGR